MKRGEKTVSETTQAKEGLTEVLVHAGSEAQLRTECKKFYKGLQPYTVALFENHSGWAPKFTKHEIMLDTYDFGEHKAVFTNNDCNFCNSSIKAGSIVFAPKEYDNSNAEVYCFILKAFCLQADQIEPLEYARKRIAYELDVYGKLECNFLKATWVSAFNAEMQRANVQYLFGYNVELKELPGKLEPTKAVSYIGRLGCQNLTLNQNLYSNLVGVSSHQRRDVSAEIIEPRTRRSVPVKSTLPGLDSYRWGLFYERNKVIRENLEKQTATTDKCVDFVKT
ncbi:MAG: hypothetical protein FWE53_03275 [Firmicutes bacterium]|nr:hypothetical protein [Bacillota bacterium]